MTSNLFQTTNLQDQIDVANIDFEDLPLKDFLKDTTLGRQVYNSIRQSKGVLIPTKMVSDMNNDFVTNLGRRRKFIFPIDESTNQVKLMQTSRASFRAELNKYNTAFDKQPGDSSSQLGQDSYDEFLFRSTGRSQNIIEQAEQAQETSKPPVP
jgi:hypothetical protein